MRVMGIDPSTVSTGWAVIDESGLVACGRVPETMRGWKALASEERCFQIAQRIGRLVVEHQPTFVYQERAEVSRLQGGKTNVHTALVLRHLGGAIAQEVGAAIDGVRSCLLGPAEWRKQLGIKGRGKAFSLAYVEGWLGIHGIPFASYCEDELEAIGIALAGMDELKKGGCDCERTG